MKHLLDKIAAVVPTLDGWCPVDKAQWLAAWIVEHKPLRVVEIGVFGGRSLVPMGLAMKSLDDGEHEWPGRVDGLDPYSNDVAEAHDNDQANRGWWQAIDLQKIYRLAVAALAASEVDNRVSIILETSAEGVKRYADASLDLVHVDGSHNAQDSTLDVRLWWPKLRPGGILVMDDTDWPQVQPARHLAASLGTLVHTAGKWEVYQKAVTDQAGGITPLAALS